MIRNLKISNYALIENLEIAFDSGFITITGETGAGKSILMGALSLILGKRADTNVLLSKEKKCIVEGLFEVSKSLRQFFEEHDLDFDTESIIRREILSSGKSRTFINDTPVTLSVLKMLGDQLVDIHSQHQSLELSDRSYQLSVVDYVAESLEQLASYRSVYSTYLQKAREITDLKDEISRISGELDFFQFQFDELEKATLKADELEMLDEEVKELEHAEDIKLALHSTSDSIEGERQILSLLSEAITLLKRISSFHNPSASFTERLESVYIEMKDVSNEVSQLAEKVSHDPKLLGQRKERLDLLYSLLQKHRVKEIDELIQIRNQLSEKIGTITFSDEKLEGLEKELLQLRNELVEMATSMHTIRKKAGKHIENEVAAMLVQLGIPNAIFQVQVDMTEDPGPSGMSDVRFLFSANKQAPAEEIAKVASGGEISRLMLSLKSLLSDYKGLPTLIFDEIDAGVSGEIADKMGAIMKRMSGGRQVIAITHLPQVAAQGNEHFLVYKEDSESATVTHIKKLVRDERITEIAKLLSGEKLSDAAVSNARELLKMN